MSKITTITCDNCGRDLRTTGYESEYYLALENRAMGHAGGAVMAMRLWPHVEQDMYFCDLRCLEAKLCKPREALPNNHGSGFATPPDAKEVK